MNIDKNNLECSNNEKDEYDIHNQLYLFVKNITSKAERTKWLQETFSHLIVTDSSKKKVFSLNNNSNEEYSLQLYKIICNENPKIVSEYLKYDYRVWQDLFSQNKDAIIEWFDHFTFDKYPIKGALALERFSFLNRDWFWDKFIVWKDKRNYSPVVVSNNLHYLMYIDVVKTINKILDENLKEFWKSDEWINSVADGELIKRYSNYFSKILLKKFHERSKSLEKLVNQFINDTDFEDLCRWILINMDEEQFCEKCKLIRANPSIESILINFASHKNFDDILILNSLFNRFRGRIVKYLEEDDQFKNILLPKISKEETLYNQFNDSLSRLLNIKNSLSSGYYNLDDLKFLLLETLSLHIKLTYLNISDRESFEYFLRNYNIPFEIVEMDRKKRKRKPHKQVKKIFVGWKIPSKYFYDEVGTKKDNEMRTLTLQDIPIYLSSFLLHLISHNIRELK